MRAACRRYRGVGPAIQALGCASTVLLGCASTVLLGCASTVLLGCASTQPPAAPLAGPAAAGASAPPGRATPPGRAAASTLHVEGNHFVDGGKTVRLLGVNHSGTESSCREWNRETSLFQGPTDDSLVAGMKTWHINAVRLPLNEDCWLGINGISPAMGGKVYQAAIVDYVQRIRSGGLYVILDLHMNSAEDTTADGHNVSDQQAMADHAHSPDFWRGIANAFAGDLGVLFDLYNEPAINDGNRTSTACDGEACWQCWRDGCSLKTDVEDPRTEHRGRKIRSVTWQTAGMQELVDAVRGTGAKNVVLAGGLNYASQLDEW